MDTDICIVGAGPAGATLSHFLTNEKIDHLLLDKASFPRDKICGDGITVDVLNVLKRISPSLQEQFVATSEMLPSWGFCFHGANGRELRYDFRNDGFAVAPFFTSRRLHLDSFLVQNLEEGYGKFLSESRVTGITRHGDGVELTFIKDENEQTVKAKMVIGAEGEKPIVTRHLGLDHFREKQNLIGALRVYYENVKGFDSGNHLEFFFDKELLPGYFWAFPLTHNQANVGLGMVSSAIADKKINLKKMMDRVMTNNPKIAGMFAEARPMEKTRGWGLPLITPKRKIAGDRYALIGDAAGMIEPFTGKGIGPGMMSARLCSEHIVQALRQKNYNMMPYQQHVYRYYKGEIKTGYTLQKTLKYPIALNSVLGLSNLSAIKKWSHNKMVTEWNRWI